MKIKRYLDTDMRQVLRRVREDQGPDAVILSNRRVDGGIEVISAVDYDEALMQQALGSPLDEIGNSAEVVSQETDEKLPESIDQEAEASPVEIASSDIRSGEDNDASRADFEELPNVWTQEPTLVQMRTEISSLRELLETQLSGLVWKDGSRRSPIRAQVLRNLSRVGLAPDIANIIANRTAPIEDSKQIWRAPLITLAQSIPVVEDDLLKTGGIAALIGPTGVGKTTTIAKIAARYAMFHGSDEISLICADAYRIGAKEHLMAFANIIGAKVHAVGTTDELTDILERLKSKKLILIDTEGTSQRDRDLANRLAAYGNNSDRVNFYLTLSAANQEVGLDETVRCFNRVPLAGAIVTKVDEAAQLGCVLSTLIRNDLPIAFVSDGQRVPDDLHEAEKKKLWLVNQAVECIQSSNPQVDERIMAESFSAASVVNA